jgi:hypothetical protein
MHHHPRNIDIEYYATQPKKVYIEAHATQPQKYLHRSPCNTTSNIFT